MGTSFYILRFVISYINFSMEQSLYMTFVVCRGMGNFNV